MCQTLVDGMIIYQVLTASVSCHNGDPQAFTFKLKEDTASIPAGTEDGNLS